jgi:hypothetical protein
VKACEGLSTDPLGLALFVACSALPLACFKLTAASVPNNSKRFVAPKESNPRRIVVDSVYLCLSSPVTAGCSRACGSSSSHRQMAVLCFPGSQWQGSSSNMRCSCRLCNTVVTAGKWDAGLLGRSQSAADRSDHKLQDTGSSIPILHFKTSRESCCNGSHHACLHWQLNT